MKRPSKKDIKAAVDKLKEKQAGSFVAQPFTPKTMDKKPNKNRIRKQGI